MYLTYPALPDTDTLILENPRGWRVEMLIKGNGDQTFTLVAQSGISGEPALLNKLQGPFHSRDQAVAARAAISQQLLNKQFQLIEPAVPIWTLQAMKALKPIRQQHQTHNPSDRFRPEDVIFD